MSREGKKNFSRCQLKTVSNGLQGGEGRLDCPVTGPDGYVTRREFRASKALPHLAKMAGRSLCRGCAFAGLSRDEYNHQLAAEAESETLRLEAAHQLDLTRMRLAADMVERQIALTGPASN